VQQNTGVNFIETRAEAEESGKRSDWVRWPVLVHSARTAVAALASLLVARLFRLPEAYWAPITTLVITQSSLGAALAVSWQRFVGTALGWGDSGELFRATTRSYSRVAFSFWG